jgi:hypothetical protein
MNTTFLQREAVENIRKAVIKKEKGRQKVIKNRVSGSSLFMAAI